jgi:cytoskeletal protein RodZ
LKSKKDISALIQENAHKLEDRPSKDAWKRLENRLDEHKSKRRFSIYRIISLAAAVIGIVGFVSVISFTFQKQDTNVSANEPSATPQFKVVALEVPKAELGFYKVVEFQNTYKNRLSKPIIEGSGKKLSVAKSSQGIIEDSDQK